MSGQAQSPTVSPIVSGVDARRRRTWMGFALAALLGVLAAGAAVGLAATSAWLVVRAAEQPPVLHLMVAIVSVRAFGLGRGVLRYGERLVGHDAALRRLAELRSATIGRLARVVPSPHLPNRGDLLARFVADVDSTLDLWVRVLLPSVVALAVSVGAAVGSALLLPSAGLALAVGVAVTAVSALALAHDRHAAEVAAARADVRTKVLTALDGAVEIRVCGAIEAALGEISSAEQAVRRLDARASARVGAIGALATVVTGLVVAVVWRASSTALDDGVLDGPALAVLVLLPLAVHEVLALLLPAVVAFPALRRSAARVREVLRSPEPTHEASDPLPVPDGPLGLALDALVIGWEAAAPLQAPLHLTVVPGTHVAVEGPSGSGKSTLAATLVRFLDPVSGSARVLSATGSVELAHLASDDVRRAIGWAAQDAHVFDSTIAANVRLARPSATDDEVWAALDRAALGGFVRSLPDGVLTAVGEHGRALSGGERQRLTLARLLLAEHRIVVLDEPTEHLDDDTARRLLVEALHALADRTVVILTHRPDLLPGVPTVLRLAAADDGPPPSAAVG